MIDSRTGIEYSDDKRILIKCPQDFEGAITIPNGVTDIGNRAFKDCSNLSNIIVPNSVRKIHIGAFAYCSNLVSIEISGYDTVIDDSAFHRCDNNKLIFYVLHGSFADDWAQKHGFKVIYIDNPPAVPEPILQKKVDPKTKIEYSADGKTLIRCPEDYKGVLIITFGVIEIADGAFKDCTGLTSVTIPSSVKIIGNYAFYGCINLVEVIISHGVTKIGNYAFYNCVKLIAITIPASVLIIGNYAFYGCILLVEVIISEGVTHIGKYAFGGCIKLISITIPASVIYLGDYAFCGCVCLVHVYILNGDLVITITVFDGCDRLKLVIHIRIRSALSSWLEDNHFKFKYISQHETEYEQEHECHTTSFF